MNVESILITPVYEHDRDEAKIENKIPILIDTSSIMKFGEDLLDLSKVGYQLLLIPENIQEQKFLSHSVARQMKEGFVWHNPLRILNGAKVIDTSRPEIKEERKKIYEEVGCALDSPWKKHSFEDPDFTFLAVARLWKVEIVVSDDKRLRRAVNTIGVRARVVEVSEFRKMVAKRRKLMKELEKQKQQVDKQPRGLVKCLVCGREVESGPTFQAHFMENHSARKAKKPGNLREHITRENEKQTHTKGSLWRVISHTTCTDICSQDSTSDYGRCNKQVTVTESSNENPQSNEMALVETQRKEDGEIVRIYRPGGRLTCGR